MIDGLGYFDCEKCKHADVCKWWEQPKYGCECFERESLWIPVSERLPNENGDYLVTLENGVVKILGYSTTQRTTYPKGFYYIKDGFSWRQMQNPVVAWMPLPESYKASPTGAESEVSDADSD